jgi:hypothetical protein
LKFILSKVKYADVRAAAKNRLKNPIKVVNKRVVWDRNVKVKTLNRGRMKVRMEA